MKVLVTGHAGFIGFHLVKRLVERGDSVVGLDVVNDYYDVGLKEARLALLEKTAATTGRNDAYFSVRANLADTAAVNAVFETHGFDRVVNLAAQAGVRYSLENPLAYAESNLLGFTNVLEASRRAGVGHFVYASTSSAYGANTRMPFSEHAHADHPLQFYAATKRANELMAHSYSHLFRLPTTGLRFFTVYGPWGRPDMALFKFTRAILAGEPIDVFNNGEHSRDFTYIDDIVEGIIRATDMPAEPDPDWDSDNPDPSRSNAPFRVLNIGNGNPVTLRAYIEALETSLGRKAVLRLLPMQPGDVPDTHADITELKRATGYTPTISVSEGVDRFVRWYREYYEV